MYARYSGGPAESKGLGKLKADANTATKASAHNMRTASETMRIYRCGVRSSVAPITERRPTHAKKLARMTAAACATNKVRYASNVLKAAVTASGNMKHAARLRSTAK